MHAELPGWIEGTVRALCQGHGGDARVQVRPVAPPVCNDPALTALIAASGERVLGADQVHWLDQPSLGAEDFAHLLEGIPGTMIRLGVAGPEGCAPLPSGSFNPDERCIGVAVRVLTDALLAWAGDQADRRSVSLGSSPNSSW